MNDYPKVVYKNSPISFANCLIKESQRYTDNGWGNLYAISNLKLQNLLYFAYGTYYEEFGSELFEFDDEKEGDFFDVSSNGFLLPFVYKKFLCYGFQPDIYANAYFDLDGKNWIEERFTLNLQAADWFEKFWLTYAEYSEADLALLSCEEGSIWQEYIKKSPYTPIPKEEIQKSFRNLAITKGGWQERVRTIAANNNKNEYEELEVENFITIKTVK